MEAKQPLAKLESIDSHIPGKFDGWGPDQLIKLANGQVWRVVDGSEGIMREKTDVQVKVVRGALGAMYMEIDGINKSPKVMRSQ